MGVRLLWLFVISLVLISCDEKIQEQDDSSLYIKHVYEYVYGPGQHASLALMSDSAAFVGNPANNNRFVYLGGYGGYIVAGFGQNVMNHDGNDFEVFALKGPVPEPAVVYVMSDLNNDSKPNDIWYELKGSLYGSAKRNYWVKYYKPLSQTENIKWIDSESMSGELKSGYGGAWSAAWWWPYTSADSLTLSGTRLTDAYVNSGNEQTQHWIVPANTYAWGYAENMQGTDYDSDLGSNKLDISNAIDAQGNAVNLTHIRFIKIQSAVFQQAGWVNEVSPELRGAKIIK